MMRNIIFLMLALAVFNIHSADAALGSLKVEYDDVVESDSDFDGTLDRRSYYKDDQLVLSTYDTDLDGKADMWFTYNDGVYVEEAMRDSNGDGKPNDIVAYDEEGNVLSIESKMTFKDSYIAGAVLLVIGCIIGAFTIVRMRKKRKAKKTKKKGSKQKGAEKEKASGAKDKGQAKLKPSRE